MDRVIVALVNSVGREGKAAHEVVWRRLPATPKARRLLGEARVRGGGGCLYRNRDGVLFGGGGGVVGGGCVVWCGVA